MSVGQSNKKQSVAARLFTAMASMFTKTFKPPVLTQRRAGKYSRPGKINPAGSKIRRSIRRGNHGVVHKNGTYANYFAEIKREEWLSDRGRPVIPLSTQ